MDEIELKPLCRWCGKPLRKHRRIEITVLRGAVSDGYIPPIPEYDGMDNKVIEGRVKSIPGYRKERVWAFSLWAGHYGCDGCDKFCTRQCAFKWAVKHA